MNQANREKVEAFIKSVEEAGYDVGPLYFNEYVRKDELLFDESSIDDNAINKMIYRTLQLAKEFSSYTKNGSDFEAGKDRWRSCLDIWRHIIYYYPSISIFDVMHNLYKMYNTGPLGVKGQFCNDIKRRTFKYGGQETIGIPLTSYMSAEFMNRHNGRITDEFDLVWDEWENI